MGCAELSGSGRDAGLRVGLREQQRNFHFNQLDRVHIQRCSAGNLYADADGYGYFNVDDYGIDDFDTDGELAGFHHSGEGAESISPFSIAIFRQVLPIEGNPSR